MLGCRHVRCSALLERSLFGLGRSVLRGTSLANILLERPSVETGKRQNLVCMDHMRLYL